MCSLVHLETTFKLVFLCHNVSWNCLAGGWRSKVLWLPQHVERLQRLKQTHFYNHEHGANIRQKNCSEDSYQNQNQPLNQCLGLTVY